MSNVQPPITLCFWYIYINQVYVNNFSAIRSKRVDRSRKERVDNHSIEADNSLAACYIVSLQYIRKLEKVDEWLESVHILPHSNRRATVGCVVWTVVVVTSVEAGGGGEVEASQGPRGSVFRGWCSAHHRHQPHAAATSHRHQLGGGAGRRCCSWRPPPQPSPPSWSSSTTTTRSWRQSCSR